MVQFTPGFLRVRAHYAPANPGSKAGAGDGGVAATYNAAEATAWTTAVTGWTAPTGSFDPAEKTYLLSCLTAAVTAGYTEGSQTGGVGPYNSSAYGVGMAIAQRLINIGVNTKIQS